VIAPGLRVLFCGINPGLYSGATGHHFARPGNRFWPALHRAGFTARQLHPSEQRELLRAGFGVVNLVNRATATAAELEAEEFVAASASPANCGATGRKRSPFSASAPTARPSA
jgi:TDG/mug DNA glycosylase family protein